MADTQTVPDLRPCFVQLAKWLDGESDRVEQIGVNETVVYRETRDSASRIRGRAMMCRQTVLESPRGAQILAAEGDTAIVVPLADLVELAQLGKLMRDAQSRYFAARDAKRGITAEGELLAAKIAEKRFDAAVKKILERKRQPEIPGVGDSPTGEEGGGLF